MLVGSAKWRHSHGGGAVKTIKIRDLRGSTLEEHARKGELVGLTRDRALIAVVIPAGQAWVEHLVDRNWSQVTRAVSEGEAEAASSDPLTTLEEALDEAGAATSAAGNSHRAQTAAEYPAADQPSVIARVGRPGDGLAKEVGLPTAAMVRRLSAVFGASSQDDPGLTRSSTIRVRDLSARRIDKAGAASELLVLTNDGLQVGIVVPVSQRFVEFLVTQNLSRIMYDVQRTELQSLNRERLDTLDETVASATGKTQDVPEGDSKSAGLLQAQHPMTGQ
jgi:antitoxin (DNA-binding transcriptional repressor) of toxin-antitoxin stability system